MSSDKTLEITWAELHRDARELARRLAEKGPWDRLVAVTRGGLIPAGILARELDIRLVDTLCVTSYDDRQRGEIRVLKSMAGSDDERLLVVDDLVDTGTTAAAARRILPRAHIATLYAKPAGKACADTFVREVPQDTWINFPWDVAP